MRVTSNSPRCMEYSLSSSIQDRDTVVKSPPLDTPALTLIIPAFNEELRIGESLEKYRDYFSSSERWGGKSSILVVDDGSSDGTSGVVREISKQGDDDSSIPIECYRMPKNSGKGAALAQGMRIVCDKTPGCLILTADADGSAEIADTEVLYAVMENLARDTFPNGDLSNVWEPPLLVNGYRTYESASASRLIFRWGFRTVVKTICGDLGVQDSQCGFKLMTTKGAQALYSDLNLLGWSHDVEVLYRAKQLRIPIAEESIRWEDKDGSKLVSSPGGVIVVCSRMFLEVLRLRVAYETGAWKAPICR